MRVSAWRLCQQCRRPEPRAAEDIGTWQTILTVVSFAAVITNSALIFFTSDAAINQLYSIRIWLFAFLSAILIFIKFVIAVYIPDVPVYVDIQMKRNKLFVDKIVYNTPDDNDDDIINAKNLVGKNRFVIRINDDDPL